MQTISNLLKTTSEHLFYAKGTGYESKEDKKQKTGKGAMIGMALVTAGSLFYGIKKGSALKKMTAAADELKRNLTNVSDELKDLKAEVAAKEAKKLVNRIKNFFSKKA